MPTLIERVRSQLAQHPGLEAWTQAALTELEQRWPNVQCDTEAAATAFARHLSKAPQLEELAGADLLLASACLAGDGRALACFDLILRVEVRRAVGPLDKSNTLVEEVTQLAREKLLVRTPSTGARLAEYSGQGALSAWLRAVAVRLALNARRPGAREVPVENLPDQPLADPDPELALLRAQYREHFKEAFAEAVKSITSRERTLLRLTTLDGLSLASVGQMYGKDASTVSRWLAASRVTLLEKTRASLGSTLGLSSTELDSVMRAADSELNLSVARLLKTSSGIARV